MKNKKTAPFVMRKRDLVLTSTFLIPVAGTVIYKVWRKRAEAKGD